MVLDTLNRMIVEAQTAKGTAFTRQEGQGMVEYGLIIAFVAIVAGVGFLALGSHLSGFISGLSSKMPTGT